MTPPEGTSTRPYLIRALYEWCTDNGFTPYVAVLVDETVQVPREFVKNNEIVLNISFDATSSLQLGNDFIEFKARFSGSAREIMVPITHVMAIYARENGQGMSFPMSSVGGSSAALRATADGDCAKVASADAGNSLPARDEKIMQLVPESGEDAASGVSDSEDPPKPPSRPRPSLTRVK
ncbi:MAG: ClpXP protease specificity-enhancing factor [Polaromonas sp.]|nr:ClpXP protease specificity-enhancing factor [Polaromonas sp.]